MWKRAPKADTRFERACAPLEKLLNWNDTSTSFWWGRPPWFCAFWAIQEFNQKADPSWRGFDNDPGLLGSVVQGVPVVSALVYRHGHQSQYPDRIITVPPEAAQLIAD
jgi:hypothetical protein